MAYAAEDEKIISDQESLFAGRSRQGDYFEITIFPVMLNLFLVIAFHDFLQGTVHTHTRFTCTITESAATESSLSGFNAADAIGGEGKNPEQGMVAYSTTKNFPLYVI